MIEVFKTDVHDADRSQVLIGLLKDRYPVCRINFDLEDIDRILRMEGSDFCVDCVIRLLQSNGHDCEVLI